MRGRIRIKKILVCLMAILVLFASFSVSLKAEEGGVSGQKMIRVPFYGAGMWDMEWEFPYSDSFFSGPSETFSRDLAKASFGLTVSAFRKHKKSNLSNQYETYLKEAGFQKIHPFGYDKPTAPDTLSGVIASKKIGDVTLVAVSPAGQGYEKEWGGNLELGNGVRHEGFQIGAEILEKEILSYIGKENLSGPLKLWITGFSRASAVSNLAAADLIESGQFEDVYAYLFAVPRTTKESRAYEGIFNICGAFDPVPLVPLQSWGYERNGTDLYLPAAEITADYNDMAYYVNQVSKAVASDLFRNNPDMNYQLHLIIEFLGELMPTSKEYVEKMQEEVTGLWTEANPDQIFSILNAVFASLDELDRRQEYSRSVVLDYLQYLIASRIQDNRSSTELRDFVWSSDHGIAANVLREHEPYIYLSWIFSDLSDEELFGNGSTTQRLAVIGDADVEVWHGDTYVNGVDQSGKPIFMEQEAEADAPEWIRKDVFIEHSGLETMVFLPGDEDFQVRIRIKNSQGFGYQADTCQIQDTYGISNGYHLVLARPGTYAIDYRKDIKTPGALKTLNGKILRDTNRFDYYTPTLAMKIQAESNSHLTITHILLIVFVIIGSAFLLLLVCLIIAIIHRKGKKTHGPYSPWYVIVPHFLFLILFVWLTVFFTKTLYLIPYARMVFAALSGLVLFLLSLRALIRNRNLANCLITVFMAGVLVVNIFVYQKSEIVGANTAVNILYCLIMAGLAALAASAFWIGKKKKDG